MISLEIVEVARRTAFMKCCSLFLLLGTALPLSLPTAQDHHWWKRKKNCSFQIYIASIQIK